MTDDNLFRRFGEEVTAMFATATIQIACSFELHQDLLQKLDGQFFLRSEFIHLEKRLTECLCQPKINQRPEGVLAPLRKFHDSLYYLATEGKTTPGTRKLQWELFIVASKLQRENVSRWAVPSPLFASVFSSFQPLNCRLRSR